VVGGYAVMKYGEPRFTKDIDLWIAIDKTNSDSVFDALREFGAPLAGLKAEDFMDSSSFYQMGRAPLRVDIMMSLPGVEFEECWKRRVLVELGEAVVPFIAKEDLIIAKESSGRVQDLLDAEHLKAERGGGGD
jgi:hypothetical protein